MSRILLAALLFTFATFSNAAQPIVPIAPGTEVDGRSPEDLSANWWQWAMSSPADVKPVSDTGGINCAVGQQGNVWFLAGGFGSSKISRTCTVPAGKYLYFPLVNVVYWPRQPNSRMSCDDARADAAVVNEGALQLFLEIDGNKVNDLKRYRVRTSKCFNILERVPKEMHAYDATPSATDGFWVALKPLSKGKHLIKFGGSYGTPGAAYGQMIQDIEYQLLVQ
jgi:hypothetical protein